ncbi:MAG: IclR family transcriptional regulator [Actinomycetia bacterium]|nr:IclR family transcriptional regulator [Actinomycetes bacterium]
MPLTAEERLVKGSSRVIAQDAQLLARVLEIMDCLEGDKLLTLTELSERTGIPKPTCHRMLQAMQRHRLVRREGNRYGIGSRVFRYVYAHVMSQSTSQIARPTLVRLRDATNLTSGLCIRQGPFRVVIAFEEADQGSERYIDIGQVAVIYAGSASKVLMAWLPQQERDAILADIEWVRLTDKTPPNRLAFEQECQRVRQQGWALSLGEREPLAFSLSVPVMDGVHGVVAALMLTGPLTCYQEEASAAWVKVLLDAGGELSRKLGYLGPYPRWERSPVSVG